MLNIIPLSNIKVKLKVCFKKNKKNANTEQGDFTFDSVFWAVG